MAFEQNLRSKKQISFLPKNRRPASKARSSFNIQIQNPEYDSQAQSHTVLAQIEASENFQNLRYKWILPEGASIIDASSLNGNIGNIEAYKPKELSISLNLLNPESDKVYLEVYSIESNTKIGGLAEYSQKSIQQKNIQFSQKNKNQKFKLMQ